MGPHGSSMSGEREAFCTWSTSGWSKEGGGKAMAEAENTRRAQIQGETSISMSPGYRL